MRCRFASCRRHQDLLSWRNGDRAGLLSRELEVRILPGAPSLSRCSSDGLRAPVYETGGRRFKSCHRRHFPGVAQRTARRFPKPKAVSSNLTARSRLSRQAGTEKVGWCSTTGSAAGLYPASPRLGRDQGSNPCTSTKGAKEICCCSLVGESVRLITGRSDVQIVPAAPNLFR